MLSTELQTAFETIANILELGGENVFKIRAYRKGAEIVSGIGEDVLESATEKELEALPGIGMALAQKIIEYRESGHMGELERLKSGLPHGLLDLLEIPGLGPKTLKILWFEFQVENLEDLEKLLSSGKLAERRSFGPKKVENLQNGVAYFLQKKTRMSYAIAKKKADAFVAYLKKCPAVEQIETGGSLRRKKETIGDIDLLVASRRPAEVVTYFLQSPLVAQVNAQGLTKASIFTTDHEQIDLRVLPPESFGAALQYFTGSKEHNILLRKIAIKKGLHLSEYGVFQGKDKIAGETEEGVYEVLGQKWVKPEERLGKEELSI